VSDFETIQRRRNIIVGLFVVFGLSALAWLVFKFGDLPLFVSKMGSYQVLVQFPRAQGIQVDTPVRFCGYQVGRVTKVKPPKVMMDLKTKRYYHQSLVVLSIANDYNDIPSNVDAKLMTRGLGSSYIELQLPEYDVKAPSVPPLVQGSTLQGSTGITSEFFPEESQKKLDDLVESLIRLSNRANEVVGDPETKKNFKTTMANLAEASGEATARLRESKQTLEHLNETLDAATEAIEDIKPTIKEVRQLVEAGHEKLDGAEVQIEKLVTSLVGASEEFGKSLSQLRAVLEKVNNGDGSAARFVNDGRLYESLIENAEQLELLVNQIKLFVERARDKGMPIRLR